MFPFREQNDLRFGVEQDVDVVFASFIRKAKDIEDIKKELGDKGRHIWIISKVRSPQY
jgi:pyruvate kinase